MLFAVQAWAADPRIGSWKLIAAQCTLDPPNKLSITDLHDQVHVVMSGDKRLDFTVGGTGTKPPFKATRHSIKSSCTGSTRGTPR